MEASLSESDIDLNPQINIPIDPKVLQNLQKPIQPPGHFDPVDALTKDEERECIAQALDELKREHCKRLCLMKSDI